VLYSAQYCQGHVILQTYISSDTQRNRSVLPLNHETKTKMCVFVKEEYIMTYIYTDHENKCI
jgi:hypothetical protein